MHEYTYTYTFIHALGIYVCVCACLCVCVCECCVQQLATVINIHHLALHVLAVLHRFYLYNFFAHVDNFLAFEQCNHKT